MVQVIATAGGRRQPDPERLVYIRQMLSELRAVAKTEQAEVLCYLIEMAYLEVGDLMGSIPPQTSPPVRQRYGSV